MAKRRNTNKQEQVADVTPADDTRVDAETEHANDDVAPAVNDAPIAEDKQEQVADVTPSEGHKKEIIPSKRKKTFEDIYNETKNDAELSQLVEAIKNYVDTVFFKHPADGQIVASMNHNLYNIILGILNEEEYGVFKKKMNLLNKIFLVEKGRYFNPVSLSKFDHYWNYGSDSRMGYHMLVEYMSEMSNPNTRKQSSGAMSITSISKYLPEGSINKLTRFYNL